MTSRDGARIAVARSGEGPPLVLVHGTTVTHRDWMTVLPQLQRHFTVYAMDRRGLGASSDPPGYRTRREFEDVAAVVDSVGRPVFLMGHSFGGLCALEAALLTPNIRKLVVYEPPIPTAPGFHPPGILERFEFLQRTGRSAEIVATFMHEIAEQDADRVELQRRSAGWQERAAVAHTAVRETWGTHFYVFHPERFRAVRVPTLLLLGGNSPAKHVAATRAVAAALPDSRVVVLPGQRHIAMHTAPELFLAEVLAFLAGPAGGA